MKTLRFLAAWVVLVAAFAYHADAQPKKNVAEVTFSISLHCSQCVEKANSLLSYIKGIKDLKISLEDQTAWMKYDTRKTSKEQILKEMAKLGYEDAKEVTPSGTRDAAADVEAGDSGRKNKEK